METEPKQVSQVHTSCRNCAFAVYENNSQTGCSLNKLEQYEKAGVEIFEVFDETDKNFQIINGRFCMFYRNKEKMENYPKDLWKEIVLNETKLPYQMIIFITPQTKYKDIKKTIQYIKNQTTQPNHVTFINYQYVEYTEDNDNFINHMDILEILQDANFNRFSLKNMYDKDLDFRTAIDLSIDSTKDLPYPFYVCFEAGFKIPETFSEELNDLVFVKMMQLGFVKPVDQINGMVVNRVVHKKYGGNSFYRNLDDKIEHKEENPDKFIYQAKDLFESLKNVD